MEELRSIFMQDEDFLWWLEQFLKLHKYETRKTGDVVSFVSHIRCRYAPVVANEIRSKYYLDPLQYTRRSTHELLEGLDLLAKMFEYEPSNRISAK
ncbi:hypothetical protein LXL04_036303 [Taraxacum kok-saghyz]